MIVKRGHPPNVRAVAVKRRLKGRVGGGSRHIIDPQLVYVGPWSVIKRLPGPVAPPSDA